MRRFELLGTLLAGLFVFSCGGDGNNSTPTSPTPSPAAATLTLSGQIIDDANQLVAGATVTVLDGTNANRTATTDASGRYTLTGLSAGGFTIRVSRTGYDDATRGINLTVTTTSDFVLVRARINLSGTLTGIYAYTNRTTGQPVSAPMTATVTQTGQTISGTFRIHFSNVAANDWTGSFSGTLSSLTPTATYQGSLTVSALISSGSGRCNGTRSSVTGTATQTQLRLTAPQTWNWNECTSSVQDTVITLNR